MMRTLSHLALWVLVAGCGTVRGDRPQDAQAADAAPGDAESPRATPSRELVGGGRMSGATFTLDVQIGHPFSQRPSTSAGFRVEGNAAIKP